MAKETGQDGTTARPGPRSVARRSEESRDYIGTLGQPGADNSCRLPSGHDSQIDEHVVSEAAVAGNEDTEAF